VQGAEERLKSYSATVLHSLVPNLFLHTCMQFARNSEEEKNRSMIQSVTIPILLSGVASWAEGVGTTWTVANTEIHIPMVNLLWSTAGFWRAAVPQSLAPTLIKHITCEFLVILKTLISLLRCV